MQGNRTPQNDSVLDYSTYLHLTSEKRSDHFLNEKGTDSALGTVDLLIDVNDTNSFINHYQSKHSTVPHPTLYTLEELLLGIANARTKYEQKDVDTNRVKKLARSIFVEKMRLIKVPSVVKVDETIYVIGGRHRITAIAHVFAHLAETRGKNEEQRQSLFSNYLKQSIRVYFEEMQSEYMLDTLIGDNDTRNVTGVEKADLGAQSLGANSTGIDTISEAALNAAERKRCIETAAVHFTRRPHKPTTEGTRLKYGKHIAAWVIFGIKPGEKLKNKLTHQIKESEPLDEIMEKAWGIFLEETKGKTLLHQKIIEISKRIIDRLIEESNQEVTEEDSQEAA